MHILIDLYLTFTKVGSMMFGGGYAMLPILQREIVDNKKWATTGQLTDYYAVGQCTPGVIAVNTATFIGSQQAGIAGGVAATLGVVTVPAILILIIAAFLSSFMDSVIVAHAFNGIRACVTALILASVVKLFKGAVKDRPTRIIYIVVLALAAAGNFLAAPDPQAVKLRAEGRVIKAGRHINVVQADVYDDRENHLVTGQFNMFNTK